MSAPCPPSIGTKSEYCAEQTSMLLPVFKRWMWSPLAAHIPSGLSPNILTLGSTLAAAGAFVSSVLFADTHRGWLVLSSVLIVLHMTLDNVDGLHARRTGQTSKVGEFLDHWLDTWNSSFIMLAVCIALQMPSWMILAMVACTNLSFFAVHWAHLCTGIMRTGKIADIEACTSAALAIFLAALVPARYLGPAVPLLAIWIATQCSWTVGMILLRVRIRRLDWIPFLSATAGLFIWYAWEPVLAYPVIMLMALLNVLSTGGLIAARIKSVLPAKPPFSLLSFLLLIPVLLKLADIERAAQQTMAWALCVLFLLMAMQEWKSTIKILRSTAASKPA